MAKTAKLSPAMQSAVALLAVNSFIGKIHGVKSTTIVALMDRGIIREAGYSSGHLHFLATTPEQVWDAAHAEDARRTAEADAYLADSANWVQVTPDGDSDAHTRQTRDGRTLLITQRRFRYWFVYVGDAMKFSAGGDWAEVRTAADRFERNAAHTEALAFVDREQHIAQSGVAHIRTNCPALKVGGCMKCTAPATVRAAQGDDSAYRTVPDLRGMTTPAEARTGISDRTAAALAAVNRLRENAAAMPDGRDQDDAWAALDIIEQALRAG